MDGKITTGPGARALHRLCDELWTFRHPGTLFHPKTFVFEGRRSGLILIGSANLTESALWTNYEDLVVIDLDLSDRGDRAVLDDFKRSFSDRVSASNAELADAAPPHPARTYIHLLDDGVGDATFMDQVVQVGEGSATEHADTAATENSASEVAVTP